MDMEKNSGINIYLNISVRDAVERLKHVKNRPLLEVANRDETIKKMIKERDVLYRKYADIVVSNSKRDAEHTADEAIAVLKA